MSEHYYVDHQLYNIYEYAVYYLNELDDNDYGLSDHNNDCAGCARNTPYPSNGPGGFQSERVV